MMGDFTLRLSEAYDQLNRDIGLNDYPIFDASYRPELNGQIFRHYKYHEIGFETPDMFRDRMDARMRLIMPYYNQLYLTQKFKFDPLSTVDMTSVTRSENDARAVNEENAKTLADNTGKSRAVNSDFPQSMLKDDGNYATSAADSASESKSESDTEGKSSSTQTGKGITESRQVGYAGSASALLTEYRQSLINIDSMIVDELANLFMGITQIDSSYTGENYYGSYFTAPYFWRF